MNNAVKCVSLYLLLTLSCFSGQPFELQDTKIAAKAEAGSVQKEWIAVLDLYADEIPKAQSSMISELIRTEIITTGKYLVMERSQIDLMLKEQGIRTPAVNDVSGAVRLGKKLDLKKILIGTVTKPGSSYVITSRIVDVEKGTAERGAKVSADEDNLLEGVSNLVSRLTGADSDSGSEPSALKITIRADKKVFKVNEDIVVTYTNFPGTRSDYISIAREGAAARDHAVYQYTAGDKEGSLTFYRGISDAGEYEVRAHTEYSTGSYNYTARYKIQIKE